MPLSVLISAQETLTLTLTQTLLVATSAQEIGWEAGDAKYFDGFKRGCRPGMRHARANSEITNFAQVSSSFAHHQTYPSILVLSVLVLSLVSSMFSMYYES